MSKEKGFRFTIRFIEYSYRPFVHSNISWGTINLGCWRFLIHIQFWGVK